MIETDCSDLMRARFVIVPSGPMDRPKLPDVSGIERFKGHVFHTSRRDYGSTGRDAEGGLTKLGDKVVGIIGTGATAVQCIPYHTEDAKHLYVFPRTPSSIDARNDVEHDPECLTRMQPGWQKLIIENFTGLVTGNFVERSWSRKAGPRSTSNSS